MQIIALYNNLMKYSTSGMHSFDSFKMKSIRILPQNHDLCIPSAPSIDFPGNPSAFGNQSRPLCHNRDCPFAQPSTSGYTAGLRMIATRCRKVNKNRSREPKPKHGQRFHFQACKSEDGLAEVKLNQHQLNYLYSVWFASPRSVLPSPPRTHRVVQSRSSSALLRHRDWKKRVTRDITALYLPSRPVASHRNSSVEGISIAILPNTLSEILASPRVGKVRLVNCHCHWLVGLLESRTKFMVSSLVALCPVTHSEDVESVPTAMCVCLLSAARLTVEKLH